MTSPHPAARPWVQPPKLNTGESRSASRLELFFDLAYVLAVAQLATSLVTDLDGAGLLQFVSLLVIVWLSWVGYTLYAKRFDTDDLLLRFAKFADMFAILGVAASISEATGESFLAFAVSYLLVRLVLVGLYWRAWRYVPEARGTSVVYLVSMTAVAALWGVSLLAPMPVAFALWGVAVAIDVAAPLVASRRSEQAPLHLEHLPERFGLLVILVLGEVIAAVVTGVHDTHWVRPSVLIAVWGFVVAGGLWWTYFDVGNAISAHALQRAEEVEQQQGRNENTSERHDLFIYGHLPLTVGVLALGVGLEDLILHPDDALPSSGGWLVVGGLVGFLVGAAMLLRASRQRPSLTVYWPVAAIAAVIGLALLGPADPLVFATCVAALTVVVTVVGTVLARNTPATQLDGPP